MKIKVVKQGSLKAKPLMGCPFAIDEPINAKK
jgi:hypothetical protein